MLVGPAPAIFSGLSDRVTDIIEELGYVGISALIALENIIPPIPSELILPLSGFMAEEGRFWLPGVIIAATIGSIIGALVLYGLGYWLGDARLRALIVRFGRYVGVTTHDLDRANDWFDRYGAVAIFIGRLVPVVRSLVSIPAGLRRMPLPRFIIYTAAGSAIWNSVLVGLGWITGDQWHKVEKYTGYLEYAVLAAIVLGGAAFIWKRRGGGRPGQGEAASPPV
jgi:membrane protein DedA with SNARE-associated domain